MSRNEIGGTVEAAAASKRLGTGPKPDEGV